MADVRWKAGNGPIAGAFLLPIVVGLMAILLLLPLNSLAAWSPRLAPPHPALASSSYGATQEFPGTTTVGQLSSHGAFALLDLTYINGTNEFVLFDARTNISKVVVAYVPGGYNVSAISTVFAGGAFVVGWYDFTAGSASFSTVSLAGKIAPLKLPLNRSLIWSFPFGNSSALFAVSGAQLLELNPVRHSLTANFSGLLPSGVGLSSMLPVGPRLYLAGALTSPNGSESAWFGFLTPSTGTVSSVAKSKALPAGLAAVFFTMVQQGGDIFVGGSLTKSTSFPFSIGTVGGLFFEYNQSTGVFKNLSSRIPMKGAGLFALEPWRTAIILSLTRYAITFSGSQLTGGLFTLQSSGTRLLNRTFLLPATFVIDAAFETAESAGWYFSGGYDNATGSGQIVALRV